MKSSSSRYALLDELRGLDLISMMLYHGMWDAVYLFGVVVPWYSAGQGRLWQQSICWVFILLSGFCALWKNRCIMWKASVCRWGIIRSNAARRSLVPERWSQR